MTDTNKMMTGETTAPPAFVPTQASDRSEVTEAKVEEVTQGGSTSMADSYGGTSKGSKKKAEKAEKAEKGEKGQEGDES